MNRYDFALNKQIVGTVTDVKWMNPHCLLQVSVQNAAGQSESWRIEYGTPNLNARNGWHRDDLKPGDRVSLLVHPLKDGGHEGTLVSMKGADGRTFYGQGAPFVVAR